jgi:SH3 domain-containing YSC84-like protein 1
VTCVKKLMICVAVLGLVSPLRAESDREATNDRLDRAGRVISEIMAAADKGIPDEVLEHAKCVVVVPHLLKGGFVFGAEYGRGVAACRTDSGCSAPALLAIAGGSWGIQIGVEGIDQVISTQDDRGMRQLSGGAGLDVFEAMFIPFQSNLSAGCASSSLQTDAEECSVLVSGVR